VRITCKVKIPSSSAPEAKNRRPSHCTSIWLLYWVAPEHRCVTCVKHWAVFCEFEWLLKIKFRSLLWLWDWGFDADQVPVVRCNARVCYLGKSRTRTPRNKHLAAKQKRAKCLQGPSISLNWREERPWTESSNLQAPASVIGSVLVVVIVIVIVIAIIINRLSTWISSKRRASLNRKHKRRMH